MNCKQALKLISEYVDGNLDERRTAELEGHLAGCKDCRETVEDFKAIVREAQNLKTVTPPERVWQKISGTLAETPPEMPARKHDVPESRPLRPFFAARLPWLSAAAAALVILVSGLALLRPWQARPTFGPAGDQYTLAKIEEAKGFFRQAIRSLTEAADSQAGTLDPRTEAAFRHNLSTVDASIEACLAAVKRDPKSLNNQNFLLAAYKDKVEILTDLINAKRLSRVVPSGAVAF